MRKVDWRVMNAYAKHGKTLLIMPIMRVITILTFATLLTLPLTTMSGCASSQTALANPLPVDTSEYDTLFTAAIEVLKDQGFRLDRHDHRFGVVTTYPKASPTIGEPWHRDNVTLEQAVASTVNYQRRRVSVRLIPDHSASQTDKPKQMDIAASGALVAPAGYLLDAQVLIEQVETPLRYLTGSTASGRMIRDLRAAPADLKDRKITENYWRVVARDTAMEQQLIARILRQSTQLVQDQSIGTMYVVETTYLP